MESPSQTGSTGSSSTGIFGLKSMAPSLSADAPTLLHLLALPARRLWRLYLDYLWNVQAGSWVARTASTFQFLAYLVITPFALLTLLDVMSYMIARTLGVVETTKASTSDTARVPVPVYVYTDADSDAHTPKSEQRGPADESSVQERTAAELDGAHNARGAGVGVEDREGAEMDAFNTGQGRDGEMSGVVNVISNDYGRQGLKPHFEKRLTLSGADAMALSMSGEPEACFFSPSDEKNLELSGALLSSPTMSRQGSPVLERRRLAPLRDPEAEADAYGSASGASSDSEPFTVLRRQPEADENLDGDGAYPAMRRRGGLLHARAGVDDASES